MSQTLTAMGDSTPTGGLQPWLPHSPPRGPYISFITNRLAPPLPQVMEVLGILWSSSDSNLKCCASQDHEPGDPRRHALLCGRVSGSGAQPAAGAEKRHPLSSGCPQQYLLLGLVGSSLLWNSLR